MACVRLTPLHRLAPRHRQESALGCDGDRMIVADYSDDMMIVLDEFGTVRVDRHWDDIADWEVAIVSGGNSPETIIVTGMVSEK